MSVVDKSEKLMSLAIGSHTPRTGFVVEIETHLAAVVAADNIVSLVVRLDEIATIVTYDDFFI